MQPGASSSGTGDAQQGADISMPSDSAMEQGSHKDPQAAEPQAGNMIVEGKADIACGTLPLRCILPALAANKWRSESLFLGKSAKLAEVTSTVGAR